MREKRKEKVKKEEREKRIKKTIKIYTISIYFVSYLRRYCSAVAYFLRFETSDKAPFLVFGVPNVSYCSI